MLDRLRGVCIRGVRSIGVSRGGAGFAKQLRKALKANRIAAAYLADDADPMLLQLIEAQCAAAGVEVVHVRSMKELGTLCQIRVGAACAGLLR